MILKWIWISIYALATVVLINMLNIHFILAPIYIIIHLALTVFFKFYHAFEVQKNSKLLAAIVLLPALAYTVSLLYIKAQSIAGPEFSWFDGEVRDQVLMPFLVLVEWPLINFIIATGKLRAKA